VLLEISLHEAKAADQPRKPTHKDRRDGAVVEKGRDETSGIGDTSREGNNDQIPLAQLSQSIGEFEISSGYKSKHILEVIPFGTAVIVHGRTHIIRRHIVFRMMQTNVMRIVQANGNAKHVAQKVGPNVIEEAKLEVENGAMRRVVQREDEGSRIGLEVKDKIEDSQQDELRCGQHMCPFTVHQQTGQRHAGHQNVDTDQENPKVPTVLAAKKVLHAPVFHELGKMEQMLSSTLFKVDMIDQFGVVDLGLFWMGRDDFRRLDGCCGGNNAHL